MKRFPITAIFNDLHLKPGNEQECLESVRHMVNHCIDLQLDEVIFAGDWFHSRSFQRQEVLLVTLEMLDLFHKASIKLHMIPGNHDKTLYESADSFMDIIQHHPAVVLYKDIERVLIQGNFVTFLPYFTDKQLVERLEKAEKSDMLISHFEMRGSKNLGFKNDSSPITRNSLRKFGKTYLGHFHNWNEITKSIVHLPSLRQNNFGEDDYKGFSIIYNDLEYEIVRGVFRKFEKIQIDVNKVTTKEIKEIIAAHSNSDNTVRIEFTGDEKKLKALDRSMFDGTGIDVKLKYDKKYDVDTVDVPEVVEVHDKKSIKSLFKTFCEDKGFDHEVGKKFLEEFLEKK